MVELSSPGRQVSVKRKTSVDSNPKTASRKKKKNTFLFKQEFVVPKFFPCGACEFVCTDFSIQSGKTFCRNDPISI